MSNKQMQHTTTKDVVETYERKAQSLKATLSVEVPFENVHVLPQTPQLIALLSYVIGSLLVACTAAVAGDGPADIFRLGSFEINKRTAPTSSFIRIASFDCWWRRG